MEMQFNQVFPSLLCSNFKIVASNFDDDKPDDLSNLKECPKRLVDRINNHNNSIDDDPKISKMLLAKYVVNHGLLNQNLMFQSHLDSFLHGCKQTLGLEETQKPIITTTTTTTTTSEDVKNNNSAAEDNLEKSAFEVFQIPVLPSLQIMKKNVSVPLQQGSTTTSSSTKSTSSSSVGSADSSPEDESSNSTLSGFSSANNIGKKRQSKKKKNFDKGVTQKLNAWFFSHLSDPYPSEVEKKELCALTGLSVSQISTWFGNKRSRYKRKLQEDNKSCGLGVNMGNRNPAQEQPRFEASMSNAYPDSATTTPNLNNISAPTTPNVPTAIPISAASAAAAAAASLFELQTHHQKHLAQFQQFAAQLQQQQQQQTAIHVPNIVVQAPVLKQSVVAAPAVQSPKQQIRSSSSKQESESDIVLPPLKKRKIMQIEQPQEQSSQAPPSVSLLGFSPMSNSSSAPTTPKGFNFQNPSQNL